MATNHLIVVSVLMLCALQGVAATFGTVQIGVLGEAHVHLRPARLLRSKDGRKLASIATKPQSSFVVADCAGMTGLSDGKKAVLAQSSITKCINVYGALVAGSSAATGCGADNSMIYMANVVAELLDTKLEGKPTDQAVADQVANFGNCAAHNFLLAGCTETQEEYSLGSPLGKSYSSQGWKAEQAMDVPATLTEEAFHFIHQSAWAKTYPTVFGDLWTSDLGKCVHDAQCVWYMHPENMGCSDASGTTCSNSEAIGDGATCTGACASFKTAGQCYATEHNCAHQDCDLPEFFHKVYLGYLEDASMAGNWYNLMVSSGANSKAGLIAKMQSTAACTKLLEDFQNTAYALPTTKLTGVYTTAQAATVAPTTVVPGGCPATKGTGTTSFATTLVANAWTVFVVLTGLAAP